MEDLTNIKCSAIFFVGKPSLKQQNFDMSLNPDISSWWHGQHSARVRDQVVSVQLVQRNPIS